MAATTTRTAAWLRRSSKLGCICSTALAVASGFATPALGQVFGPSVPLNTNLGTDSGDDDFAIPATDGLGNWLVVWQSEDSLDGTIGTDSDILVARSTDMGASWTSPIALNTLALSDTADDRRPHVATDGAGNWVAVWVSDETLGGTIGSDYDVFISRSSDVGATWSPPTAIDTIETATFAEIGAAPRVTTDGAGNWVLVWNSTNPLGGVLGTDFDIIVARSTDAGATWTTPVALNTDAASDSFTDRGVRVVTDGVGNWLAVWQRGNIHIALSTDAGATWSPPVTVAASPRDSEIPDIATDGAGNWVVVWQERQQGIGDADIYVSRSSDLGATWSPWAFLNSHGPTDIFGDIWPSIATDGVGNWVAAWHSFYTLGGTLGAELDLFVSRSTDAGASWSTAEPLNTDAATDTSSDVGVVLATDGAGTWIATYHIWNAQHGTAGMDNDIFAATVPAFDIDGDGLSDGMETILHATDPQLADTDSDGLDDGDEIALGSDPLKKFDPVPALGLLGTAVLVGLLATGGVARARSRA